MRGLIHSYNGLTRRVLLNFFPKLEGDIPFNACVNNIPQTNKKMYTFPMNILFYLPAVLFLISGLPQMIKLIKTKSSEDISISMYLITDLAIAIIVIDAAVSKNYSILVSNAVSLILTGINTFLTIKYRRRS
jgi:MtN3 and saliva related transmembrane protein